MYRVRTVISGGQGGPYLSTMYFNVVGGLTAANANAAVGTFWNSVKAKMGNSLSYATEAEVAEVDIATGQVTGIAAVTPQTGTGTPTTDMCPWTTQGLIRWRTGIFVGGREVRGRTFVPGPTEVENTAGVPAAAYVTALNAAASALIADANSDLMVYSKKNRDAVPVLSGSTWSQWAVLRSRRA